MIASTIHNVGLIHKHRKEYDRALDSFQESIGICERIGFQLGLIFNSCCMAEVHLVKGNLKHALELCNHALEISKDVGAKEYLSKCKRTLGMIYRKMRRWDEATNNLKEAISMCRDLGREKELGISYLEYGRTAVEKGDLDEGRASIKKSISVFAKLGLARELEEAERILGNLA